MALIKKLQKGVKERESLHKETKCKYFIVHTSKGKLLQLDTYGSKDRVIKDKTSQSIQLNVAAIKELKKILIEHF